MRHEAVDRVPVMCQLAIGHYLLNTDATPVELWYTSEGFARAMVTLQERYRFDGILINLLGNGPLIGPNHTNLGPRFPDMSQPYSAYLNEKILTIAQEEMITLHKGVYVAVAGPNLETRAEYRFLRMIGADVVGMSTVPEVIVANHAGLPCAAISVLTDECDPDNLQPIDIKDIIQTASIAEDDLIRLIKRLILEIH